MGVHHPSDEMEDLGGVAGMTNTYEPQRVNAILRDNRELIQKLKEAEEESIQKQNNFRFNKKPAHAKQAQSVSLPQARSPSNLSPPRQIDQSYQFAKPQKVVTNNRLNTPGL